MYCRIRKMLNGGAHQGTISGQKVLTQSNFTISR